jgi:GH15 family glucan-1,4-alpha-glucosidase
MERYPSIADHGLIGDLQTAALVSSQGVVEWFAAPRFDSPSIFAALLDHDRGGFFRIGPDSPEITYKQLYYPDSAVLVTRFMSPDGVGEVIDCMPPDQAGTPTDRHTLIRGLRVVRGAVRFALQCRPRFDYGRATHTLDLRPDSAVFTTAGMNGHLRWPTRWTGSPTTGIGRTRASGRPGAGAKTSPTAG